MKTVTTIKDTVKRSYAEIAKSSGAYYSFVHRVVHRLAKDGVITKDKAGKAYLCSLNINNEKG